MLKRLNRKIPRAEKLNFVYIINGTLINSFFSNVFNLKKEYTEGY